MANPEDVSAALEMFHQHRANHAFEEMYKSDMGLVAVLRYLGHAQQQGKQNVTSREISDALGVSSARMTIILKKLAQKQWISKGSSATDARAVAVTLTEAGNVVVAGLQQRMHHTMEQIVDELGLDELQNVMRNLAKIHTILHENRPNQLEEDYA